MRAFIMTALGSNVVIMGLVKKLFTAILVKPTFHLRMENLCRELELRSITFWSFRVV